MPKIFILKHVIIEVVSGLHESTEQVENTCVNMNINHIFFNLNSVYVLLSGKDMAIMTYVSHSGVICLW